MTAEAPFERYAVFERLSPALVPDLTAGHYALIGTSDGFEGAARPTPDTVWIDRKTGEVHRSATPAEDLLDHLGYGVRCADLQSAGDVIFTVGTPGLFARAVALAVPDAPASILDDDTICLAGLTSRDVIAVVIEALGLLGRTNARRDLDSLADDPHSGLGRIIPALRPVAT